MAQSKSPRERYPEPELVDEYEAAEYWLINYNRRVFKTLSDIHGNTETTRDDVAEIKQHMATKKDLADVKSDIAKLTELIQEGFATLGVNIANGDHRVGGRAIRPVK